MAVDCYTTFDETCGDSTGVYGTPGASAGSGSPDIMSWISTIGGTFIGAYSAINKPSAVVGGRGIPGSPTALSPTRSTGISTILVVVFVGILVWLGIRRR